MSCSARAAMISLGSAGATAGSSMLAPPLATNIDTQCHRDLSWDRARIEARVESLLTEARTWKSFSDSPGLGLTTATQQRIEATVATGNTHCGSHDIVVTTHVHWTVVGAAPTVTAGLMFAQSMLPIAERQKQLLAVCRRCRPADCVCSSCCCAASWE